MDPYGQHPASTSLNSAEFFIDLQQQQQQQHHHQTRLPLLQHQASVGPRQYKSRKVRPCDFCRTRQVACKIETAPPCNLCASHNRECTFVQQPKKKRRPNPGGSADAAGTHLHTPRHQSFSHIANGHQLHDQNDLRGHDRGHGHGSNPNLSQNHSQISVLDPALAGLDGNAPPLHQHSLPLDNGYISHFNDQVFDPRLMQDHSFLEPQMQAFTQSPTQNHYSTIDNASPYDQPSPGLSHSQDGRPLDYHASRSVRFLGETGELNPYLVRHHKYDENDEAIISKIAYRRFPRTGQHSMEAQEPPALFMLVEDSMNVKGEPRFDEDVLIRAEHDLAAMVSEEEGLRLVNLYFRFVNPYFQILPRSQTIINSQVSIRAVRAWPLCLRASVYATALPFMLYDPLLSSSTIHNPPSSIHLYRMAWQLIQHDLHAPRLTTLQACLLLLQRAPTNRYTSDTPFKTSLLGWTVSLAQNLGLFNDPCSWNSLPTWELTLRKRLWHAVYITDKWTSLGAGFPSHIQASSFDVPPLLPSDCEDLPPSESGSEDAADSHFRLLSDLTIILSDIMDTFYTLSASKQTCNNFTHSLELAWPLRSRLSAWNAGLPLSLSLRRHEGVDSRGLAKLSGNPSLSLAYIVATMTLYKALLRPLLNRGNDGAVQVVEKGIEGSIEATKNGARICARDVAEFVEGLGRGSLEGFWHSFSRANFAIASSFLMQLHMEASKPTEKEEIGDLVNRWRWAMRIGSGTMGNGLMSLGLLRMDGLLLENQTGQDGIERRATVG